MGDSSSAALAIESVSGSSNERGAGAGAGVVHLREVPTATDGTSAVAEAGPPSALSDARVSGASRAVSPPVQGRRRAPRGAPRLRSRHAQTASPTIASALGASQCSSHDGDDTSL